MYKRNYAFIMICILLLSLSGCFYVVVDRTYELQNEASEISSICIYKDYDRYSETQTPLKQLDSEDFSSFATDIENLPFTEGKLFVIATADPSFYFGKYTVVIIYQNGGKEIISNTGYQEYTDEESGHGIHYYCEEEYWNEFILKYIEQTDS